MTKLPASVLGLQDRGEIKKNYWADLVIFDENKIIDNATWENPHQFPSGINWVIVNGEVAIQNGNYLNSLSGKILKHSL